MILEKLGLSCIKVVLDELGVLVDDTSNVDFGQLDLA